MKKLDFDRHFELAETVFQVLFLIYTILGFNSVSFGTPIISCFMWASFVLGAGLLLVRLRKWKDYIAMPGLVLLLAMCVICVASILVNLQYNLKKNIIYLIFWVFYFLMFYAQSKQTASDLVKKRFLLLGHVICVCAFILVVISLWMMYARYSEVTHINGSEVTRGFTYGRLFGAYLTPNGGAVVASIVIFLSLHFIGKYKSLLYRIWAALNILVQFAYITFSDSRSGTLALAFGGAVYVCFAALGRLQKMRGRTKVALVVTVTVMTLVAGVFAPSVAQKAYNGVVVELSEQMAQQQTQVSDKTGTSFFAIQFGSSAAQTNPEDIIDSYVVDRGYDLSKDISNRRFDVWKSGIEIFAQRPWLGTTFCGFLPFALEYLPDTYIVTNDYLQMDTLDNDFVNLLVSNGIFGFLLFVLFVLCVLIYILRNYARMEEKDPQIPVMMAVCMAAATFSMFTSGVLYMHSPFSAFFWLALGGLVVLVSNGNKEKNNA